MRGYNPVCYCTQPQRNKITLFTHSFSEPSSSSLNEEVKANPTNEYVILLGRAEQKKADSNTTWLKWKPG